MRSKWLYLIHLPETGNSEFEIRMTEIQVVIRICFKFLTFGFSKKTLSILSGMLNSDTVQNLWDTAIVGC